MPIYEFACEGCGPFEERRAYEEASEAARCPTCEGEARRVYSMPNLKSMSPALSGAMDRAEKSAHEPEVARRKVGGDHAGHRHVSSGRPWALGH